MDLISGLKSEFFRPLVTLIVPGSVAVAPFVLVAQFRIPAVATFWDDHATAFVSVFVTVVVAAGLLLEDIGARIEESCWDRLMKKEDQAFDSDWHRYLRLQTRDEVIGQRYLRTLLTRMKFELATAPALVCHLVGLNWANYYYGFLTRAEIVSVSVGIVALTVYRLAESYGSARVMARLRRDVIAAVETSSGNAA